MVSASRRDIVVFGGGHVLGSLLLVCWSPPPNMYQKMDRGIRGRKKKVFPGKSNTRVPAVGQASFLGQGEDGESPLDAAPRRKGRDGKRKRWKEKDGWAAARHHCVVHCLNLSTNGSGTRVTFLLQWQHQFSTPWLRQWNDVLKNYRTTASL